MSVIRRVLLDTHAWLWFFAETNRVPTQTRDILREAADSDQLYIAAYSLFEAVYAAQRKRIVLTTQIEVWLENLLAEPSVRILPLTPVVALASTALPLDFHGDPGDRLIVATAISEGLTLCTHDHALIRFGKQGLFDFLEV